MNRDQFIAWFNSHIATLDQWGEHREEVNYEPMMFDYYNVEHDHVTYTYDEMSWGKTDTIKRKYSFEEFVEAFEKDMLKDLGEQVEYK